MHQAILYPRQAKILEIVGEIDDSGRWFGLGKPRA